MKKLAILAACAALYAVAAAAPTAGADTESLVAHMHEHYKAVTQVQAAIIRGNLPAARAPAQWLADHPAPAGIPAEWNRHLKTMREAALATAQATDFVAAAMAASQMANACGSCHIDADVYDLFEYQPEPEPELGGIAHMQRHQWAADRMWEGLVGPAEEAWSQGAGLLFEAPLGVTELHAEDDGSHSVRNMARRIHQVAANGMMEMDRTARAEIYAEFLSNCAACHARLRQGPGD